jgi:hypothetical protein
LKNTTELLQSWKNFRTKSNEKEVASYAVSRSSGRLKNKFVVRKNVQTEGTTEAKTKEFTEMASRTCQSLSQNYT